MRRALLVAAAAVLVGAAVRVPGAEGGTAGPQASGAPDSAEVARFLAGLRASDPVICAMATDILGTGIHWRSDDEEIAVLRDAPPAAPAARERFRSPIQHAGAVRQLVPELGSPNACLRRAAAALLGESEVPLARAALRQASAAADPRVREAGTFGLGVAGDTADAARLRALLQDQDPGVARLAAWAVGAMEDPAAEGALVALLRHRDAGVRRAAAWALGRR